jgi:hypothetical protein
MAFLLLILNLVLSPDARALERPPWTNTLPKADAEYKYFVGRALEEFSEKEAWRLARDQAQETAIRENYGVETSIASSSYESTDQVALNKRVLENFPSVRLIDFEQIDSHVERENGRVSVWILFRYPLKQIEAESERLKSANPLPSPAFNEVGKTESRYSTQLEITSEPSGIPVFLDGERWGVTPLRVTGSLTVGAHKMKLSDPRYQDAESALILNKGMLRRIHVQLKPAIARLRLRVNPDYAQVLINGVPRREASLEQTVMAGQPVRVEARQVGFETQIQEIEVQKDETRLVEITLNPIKRPTEILKPKEVDPSQRRTAWQFGILLGYSESSAPKPLGLPTLQMGITLEKRFLWCLGLRGGLSVDVTTDDTETSKETSQSALSGTGSFLGLPIYIPSTGQGIYLMPEIGRIKHDRLVETNATQARSQEPQFLSLSARREGIRLGYVDLDSHLDLWIALHRYHWPDSQTLDVPSVGLTVTWSGWEFK